MINEQTKANDSQKGTEQSQREEREREGSEASELLRVILGGKNFVIKRNPEKISLRERERAKKSL